MWRLSDLKLTSIFLVQELRFSSPNYWLRRHCIPAAPSSISHPLSPILSQRKPANDLDQNRWSSCIPYLGYCTRWWIFVSWLHGSSRASLMEIGVVIKLADTKNDIYISYGCSIIAMILITVPLVILVKGRQHRQEHVNISNAPVTVAADC